MQGRREDSGGWNWEFIKSLLRDAIYSRQLTVVQPAESGDSGLEVDECGRVLGYGRNTHWGDEGGVGQAGRQLQQGQVIVVVGGIVSGVDHSDGGGQLDEGRGQRVGSGTDSEGSVALDAVGSGQHPVTGDQRTSASNRGCSHGTAHPHMPRELASGRGCASNNAALEGSGIVLWDNGRAEVLLRVGEWQRRTIIH